MAHSAILSQFCVLCLLEFYFLWPGKRNAENACFAGFLGKLNKAEEDGMTAQNYSQIGFQWW